MQRNQIVDAEVRVTKAGGATSGRVARTDLDGEFEIGLSAALLGELDVEVRARRHLVLKTKRDVGDDVEEAALGAEPGSRFPRGQAAGDRWIVSWTRVEASAASTSRGRAQLRFAVVKPTRPPQVRTAARGGRLPRDR